MVTYWHNEARFASISGATSNGLEAELAQVWSRMQLAKNSAQRSTEYRTIPIPYNRRTCVRPNVERVVVQLEDGLGARAEVVGRVCPVPCRPHRQ